MEQIRLGTIGTGKIVHSILNAVEKTEGICLEAVYSRTEENGKRLAQEYHAEKVYTDLDEMLSDEAVNCVYVASPNSLHYAQVKKTLLKGKHVICEKPFCPESWQLEELTRLAKEKQLFLIDATPTAFLPNFELLKSLLAKIGKLRLVLCNYSQYSSRYDLLRDGKIPNIFSLDFAGGCIQDINYYNVYIAASLFGLPEQMTYYPNICPAGTDSSGILILKYPDFIFEAAGAKDTWGVNSVQMEGEDGFIYIEDGSNGIRNVKLVTKQGERFYNEQPDPDRYDYEIQKITDMMKNEQYEKAYELLRTTTAAISIIEQSRKAAGIHFLGDLK